MPTSEYKNEKHCREETIGRAAEIVQAARRENRNLSAAETTSIDALLTTAEIVLGVTLPRDPSDLLSYARKPLGHGRNRQRTMIQ